MDVSVAYHSDGCKPEDSGNHAADSSHKAGRKKSLKHRAIDITAFTI